MNVDEIALFTEGLDDIVIENGTNEYLEITLFEENPQAHSIETETADNQLKIQFKNAVINSEETIFRKYITRRLHRARAKIKIPSDKSIAIYGENIGVVSNSYEGNLSVVINKGNIALGKISGNTTISLFQGNISATTGDTFIDVTTTNGLIMVNDLSEKSPYISKPSAITSTLKISSIHANVTIRRTTL
ncbi:hypothetical protein [Tenacibaculum sp. SG-28]|uniref:hypothetical protein n=1 Tax=Tenacibaculum sp. SG-28 TaxID=754426 RepID=UPI000CF4A366|nr:hypothetical protein [Tenacibaculum sp. SG-28]PQJ21585.1 hypothetical protein BSU00_05600 [Tenacibaculum sp. SG-28]